MQRKLALLGLLYLVQGLPYGFQTFALPLLVRRAGGSLTAIGLLGGLALPWLFKPLWAPLIDRYGATRKAWIVPLMILLGASLFAAGLVDVSTPAGMTTILALVFAMNLFAATQDIAVDGLAVDVLDRRELGVGNTAQVVGYKVGMLLGGAVFVAAAVHVPWHVLFAALAALPLLAAAVAARAPEAPRRRHDGAAWRLGDILRALGLAVRAPGSAALLLFIGTYKIGESMTDAMWKPFLVDAGFDDAFLGGVFGTVGMAASIVGSLLGGWLAVAWPLERALWLPAAGRVLPLTAQWWLAATGTGKAGVVAVTCAEHLFAGALTTVVFALMMSRVDKRIGASHYTLLAGVEVLGKFPGGWLSGPIATAWGYPALFALAAGITAALLALIPMLSRPRALTVAEGSGE